MDDTNPFERGLARVKPSRYYANHRVTHAVGYGGSELLCRPGTDIWTKCEAPPAHVTEPTCKRCVAILADEVARRSQPPGCKCEWFQLHPRPRACLMHTCPDCGAVGRFGTPITHKEGCAHG